MGLFLCKSHEPNAARRNVQSDHQRLRATEAQRRIFGGKRVAGPDQSHQPTHGSQSGATASSLLSDRSGREQTETNPARIRTGSSRSRPGKSPLGAPKTKSGDQAEVFGFVRLTSCSCQADTSTTLSVTRVEALLFCYQFKFSGSESIIRLSRPLIRLDIGFVRLSTRYVRLSGVEAPLSVTRVEPLFSH